MEAVTSNMRMRKELKKLQMASAVQPMNPYRLTLNDLTEPKTKRKPKVLAMKEQTTLKGRDRGMGMKMPSGMFSTVKGKQKAEIVIRMGPSL